MDFDATCQYSAFVKYLRKNGNAMKQFINYLYTSRRLMIQLEGRSCVIFSFSNIIKMCPSETSSKIRVGKHFSDVFHIKNALKQGDVFRH